MGVINDSFHKVNKFFSGVDFDKMENIQSFLLSVLMLPEEEFEVMGDVFLSQMKTSMSQIEDKLILAQALNIKGIKIEDFDLVFEKIMSNIEAEFKEKLSSKKIDFLKKFVAIISNNLSETQKIGSRIVKIPVEISEEGKKPEYAYIGDAGLDLYSAEDITIHPNETKAVRTGIKIELPKNYVALVFPKSGISLKTKLRISNSVGVIDSNYTGEIKVLFDNIEPDIAKIQLKPEFNEEGKLIEQKVLSVEYGKDMHITKGQKIAQLIVQEIPTTHLIPVNKITENIERGDKGFGSSGV